VKKEAFPSTIREAIEAALDKQATKLTVLDLSGLGAFAEYFLLCTAGSTPQMRAIADAVEEKLHREGRRPEHREGGTESEWLLLDYGEFVVHIFSERGREYYDLERLWRVAPKWSAPEEQEAGPRAE
jgi:ribosome-associated protein